MKMLSMRRPLPSMEMRVPSRFSRSIQAKEVNWLPWSVFMISVGPKRRLHTITAAFAEARDKAGLTWPAGKTPPTFHEIRSLAARLYAEQGIDAQALLGHKSPDMTALYRDVRGSEWIEIRLG